MTQRYSPIPAAFAATLASACLLFACEMRTTDRDLVYLDPYQTLSTLNMPAGAFQAARTWTFVDPRSRAEYEKEHIANAISLPFQDMTLEAESVLRNFEAVVVYDTDYDDVLAKSASKRLLELRFKEVYTLEGGLKAWKKAGYETESGLPANAPELPDLPVK
jgi:rhodanese-related sulfurtransferase